MKSGGNILLAKLNYVLSSVFSNEQPIQNYDIVVGPLPRVRPRNGILALLVLVLLLPLRSEFIGEL